MTESHRAESRWGLKTNAFWGVWANVMMGCGRFLAFIILAKFFSSAGLGQFMLAWAIVLPLAAVINMEVRMVLVTDARGELTAGECLGVRFLSNAVLWGILMSTCYLARGYWNNFNGTLLLGVGGIKMVESWAEIYLGVLQKRERMNEVAVSQTLKTLLLLVWTGFVALRNLPLIFVPVGWIMVLLAVTWAYDRVRAGRCGDINLRFDYASAVKISRRAFWLGLFLMMVHLNESTARYFIDHWWGEVGVAYYGMMMIFVTGAVMAQTGLNQSVLGRLAVYYHNGEIGRFGELLGKVGAISLLGLGVLFLLVWFGGEQLLHLVSREEYVYGVYGPLSGPQPWGLPVFVVVMLGGVMVVLGMVAGDAIVACHRFKSRMIAVALGLAVNAWLCREYVAEYGLVGAAWSLIAASTVVFVICGLVLISAILSTLRINKI